MEGCRKLKISRKETHDTGDPWPHLDAKRSKVKVTRTINAETENASYFQKGWPTNFKLGIGMEYDDLLHWHVHQRSKVKVITSCHQSDACLPIIRQWIVAETPKLAERLSVPLLIFLTRLWSKDKDQIPRSPGCLTPLPKISLQNWKAYKRQTWNMDGVWWPTSPMCYDLKGQGCTSHRQFNMFAHNWTKKSHRSTKFEHWLWHIETDDQFAIWSLDNQLLIHYLTKKHEVWSNNSMLIVNPGGNITVRNECWSKPKTS